MVVVTVRADGAIRLPAAVRERLGIQPGALVALDEGKGDGSIQLRVLPVEAQLVEENGVWTIRARYERPEDKNVDWTARSREERDAALLEKG